MATATIVKCWDDGTKAYMAARVAEGGKMGTVEYLGETSLVNEGEPKTKAQIKADLTADIAAKRALQVRPAEVVDGTITGTVTV
jgi:hypothetical protein